MQKSSRGKERECRGRTSGGGSIFAHVFLGADTAPRPHLWFIPLPAGGGTSAFSMVANHTTKHYKLTTSKEQNR